MRVIEAIRVFSQLALCMFLTMSPFTAAHAASQVVAFKDLAEWITTAKDEKAPIEQRLSAISELEKVVQLNPASKYKAIWEQLKLYHDALYALNRLMHGKEAPGSMKKAAQNILKSLGNDAADDNLFFHLYGSEQGKHRPELDYRLGQDAIAFLTRELGTTYLAPPIALVIPEFLTTKKIELKLAYITWLGEHFVAVSGTEGFYPAPISTISTQVKPDDLPKILSGSSGWRFFEAAYLGYAMASPFGKVLAYIAYAARNDTSEEVRMSAAVTWSAIEDILIKAKNERMVSPNARQSPAMVALKSLQSIRQRLANRWLKEVTDIYVEWSLQEEELWTGNSSDSDQFSKLDMSLRSLLGAPPSPKCAQILEYTHDLFKKLGR